jgi:hypothetical protein
VQGKAVHPDAKPARLLEPGERKPSVQPTSLSAECPRGPAATKNGFTYAGHCEMYLRYWVAYSPPVMFPPQPHDSLPTPQYLMLKGAFSPLAARSSAREIVPAGALLYDTQS